MVIHLIINRSSSFIERYTSVYECFRMLINGHERWSRIKRWENRFTIQSNSCHFVPLIQKICLVRCRNAPSLCSISIFIPSFDACTSKFTSQKSTRYSNQVHTSKNDMGQRRLIPIISQLIYRLKYIVVTVFGRPSFMAIRDWKI